MGCAVKLCYQVKADVSAAYWKHTFDVDVSIVPVIKSQVIHLTWRLLDQCRPGSRLIPVNKMAVLICERGGGP